MAGVLCFTQSQRETRERLKKAKTHHDRLVEERDELVQKLPEDDDPAQARLLTLVDKLKSSSKSANKLASDIEDQYGKGIIKLQEHKDLTTFLAKNRDFVSQFEDMAFMGFRRRFVPKGISPETASAVASKNGVLSTLRILARSEGRKDKDEDYEAFVEDFQWLKKAWEGAVVAKGLSFSDYQAVHNFKQQSNNAFHGADSVEDALQMLESQAPVPVEMQKYKEPLKNLLKLLQAAQ